MIKRSALCLAVLCALGCGPSVAAGTPPKFDTFISDVKREAKKNGVDGKYLRALDTLTPNAEVQRLAARQPEYVKPIWSYLVHMVTEERLRLGKRELARYAQFFDGLEEKYGVPRTILVAIWGVETNYGGNKGSFDVCKPSPHWAMTASAPISVASNYSPLWKSCNRAISDWRISRAAGPVRWGIRNLFRRPIWAIQPMGRAMASKTSGPSRRMRWPLPHII